jgi:hypothetical protein
MSFQDKEAEFCLLLTRMQNEPEDWRRCAPSRRSRGAFRTDMRTPRHAAREAGLVPILILPNRAGLLYEAMPRS